MAVNKDSGDVRTFDLELVEVDPIAVLPGFIEWPANIPPFPSDTTMVTFTEIISLDDYFYRCYKQGTVEYNNMGDRPHRPGTHIYLFDLDEIYTGEAIEDWVAEICTGSYGGAPLSNKVFQFNNE